jgi:hypothetical protein
MSKDIKHLSLPKEDKVCPPELETTITINANGDKIWRNVKGEIHRDNDLPAIEWYDGDKEWYQNGQLHRGDDKPAVEYSNGDKIWYQNGQTHRENDLPAVEYKNGDKHWYKNGKRQREGFILNGVQMYKPTIEYANGNKTWHTASVFELKLDVRMYEYNGKRVWYHNGKEIYSEPM